MRCNSCKSAKRRDIQCNFDCKKNSNFCGKHVNGKHVYKNIKSNVIIDVEDEIEHETDVEDEIEHETDVEDEIQHETDVEDEIEHETDVEDEIEPKLNKDSILKLIKSKIQLKFTGEFIKLFKTVKGNTQQVERNYISEIEKILTELNLTYKKASSQGSKDFQNINNTGLNIEVKKSDSFTIICNDTCPNEDIEYLIIFTGKPYVNKPSVQPQLIFINGGLIQKESTWLKDFQIELDEFKNKWCRGDNKKNLNGYLRTYVRPTYQFDIKSLLDYSI